MRSLTLLLLLPLCLFGQRKDFLIQGYIKGAVDRKIYLSNLGRGYGPGVQNIYYDSVKSADGHFAFRGHVDEIGRRSIEIEGGKGWLTFVAENTNIQIEGDTASIWLSKVSGSPQDSLARLVRQEQLPYIKKLNASADSIRAALGRKDSLLARTFSESNREYNKKIAQTGYDFLKAHPDAYSNLELLSDIDRILGNAAAKEAYGSLSEGLKKHSLAKAAYYKLFELDKTVALQKKAPGFRQKDTYAKWVDLDAYKGKYVLLDFWASWCGPCRAENPNVLAAYEKYKGKNFEVLGISLDADKQKWLQAVKEDKLPWKQVSDLKGGQNEVALLYGIESIPRNFLIDPEGNIVARDLRGEKLQEALGKIFGNL